MDLAALVDQQSKSINSIEDQIDNALMLVQEGSGHLEKAKEHKDKYRKRKLLCGVVLLVIILIIIIVVVLELQGGSDSE